MEANNASWVSSSSPRSASSDRTIGYEDKERQLSKSPTNISMTESETERKVSNWLEMSRNSRPLALPDFSSSVREALDNNRCHEIWTKMIREMAEYYMKYHPELRSDTAKFQEIGRMMYQQYRCVERLGKHPWVRATG